MFNAEIADNALVIQSQNAACNIDYESESVILKTT